MTKITYVEPGSIAEEAGIEAGDFLVALNDKIINDIEKDLRFIIDYKISDFTIDESDMLLINNMEYMGSGLDSDTLTLFN